MPTPVIASSLPLMAQLVTDTPEISNATARIALWLAGVMIAAETDTLSLSFRQIQRGVELDGREIPGTGCRVETVRDALVWLHEHEWFEVKHPGLPHAPKSIRLCL